MDLIRIELSDYVHFDAPLGGLAIWMRLNDGINKITLPEDTNKKRVSILPTSLFSESSQSINAIRLGFASLNLNELSEGISRLKHAFLT